MKCLLVSYTGLGINSTEHVVAFGRGLTQLGYRVSVAVVTHGDPHRGFDFFGFDATGTLQHLGPADFSKPADVVHVWTPRAAIWRFFEEHHGLIGGRVVLHLEDDEDEVLREMGVDEHGPDKRGLRARIRAHRLENWSHPLLTKCLAQAVSGATFLSPDLASHFPSDTRKLHVLPPLGPEWWTSESRPQHGERKTNLLTVVYAGGIHPAVVKDFTALCDAVAILAKEGRPVRLVRCGPPIAEGARMEFPSGKDFPYEDLGYLSHQCVRELLETSSVLVQPGAPSTFNRRRLPAKIPPYLASGTPVVMPSYYPWLGARDGEHAVTFERGDAAELAEAISQVLDNPDRSRAMGQRAANLARKLFSPSSCCKPLAEFYETLPKEARIPWHQIRKPRVEIPLLVERMHTEKSPALPAISITQLVLDEVRHPARWPGRNTVAQLFWPTQRDYSEQESSVCPLFSGRWNRLVFGPTRLLARRAPRLDPGDQSGIIEIAAISYRAANGALLQQWRSPNVPAPECSKHGSIISLPLAHHRVWRWLSTGNDPQLLLPRMDQDTVVRIECWLRWTPVA